VSKVIIDGVEYVPKRKTVPNGYIGSPGTGAADPVSVYRTRKYGVGEIIYGHCVCGCKIREGEDV